MNNLKKYVDFVKMNENLEINESKTTTESFKLYIKGNTLQIKVGDKTAEVAITPNNHIRSAKDQSSGDIIDVVAYQVKHGDLVQAVKSADMGVTVLDNEGRYLKDGVGSSDVYLVISTPKGYNGEISSMSGGIGIHSNGATRIYGAKPTTWGFYKMPDLKGLNNGEEIKPYKRARFTAHTPVKPLKIQDGFVIDKSELKDSTKEEIKTKLKGVDTKRTIGIMSGASLDNDDVENDFNLVVGRYNSTKDYLVSLGFNNIKFVKMPKSVKDTDNIYGKFNKSDKEDSSNRNLLIKVK